ncbi:RDD family protein [Brevibacillus sp. TJ4]|uniref:RDD family protein n=1 Tax=Brevibacillus sp. TJ4 TaxID=3234853 RepID=UPI0037CDF861
MEEMTQIKHREVSVVTPEHVQLRFQTAGLGSRAAAQLIDGCILFLVNLTLILLFSIVAIDDFSFAPSADSTVTEVALAIFLILLFLINFGYSLLLEAFWSGQTVGKRLMRLRVIRDTGQPITFLSAVLRNLFRIVDMLPSGYFLGALVVFFHPKDKRIGDLVAGTIVVSETGATAALSRKKQKAGEAYTPLELTDAQRQAITREDWQLLSSFIARLSSLAPDKKSELGKQIAQRLSERLGWSDRNQVQDDPLLFLQQLHHQLQQDWQLGRKS